MIAGELESTGKLDKPQTSAGAKKARPAHLSYQPLGTLGEKPRVGCFGEFRPKRLPYCHWSAYPDPREVEAGILSGPFFTAKREGRWPFGSVARQSARQKLVLVLATRYKFTRYTQQQHTGAASSRGS